MSREERRQYQRMMKGQDPYSAPRGTRDPRRKPTPRPKPTNAVAAAPSGRRFWTRTAGAAVVMGVVAFSMQWHAGMPWALYVGVGAFGFVLLAAVAGRALWQRAADRRPPP